MFAHFVGSLHLRSPETRADEKLETEEFPSHQKLVRLPPGSTATTAEELLRHHAQRRTVSLCRCGANTRFPLKNVSSTDGEKPGA